MKKKDQRLQCYDKMMDESALEVHQRERHGEPLNAETKPDELIKSLETPTQSIFHRNHGDIVKVPQEIEIVEHEWQIVFDIDDSVWTHSQSNKDVEVWKEKASDSPRSITYGDLTKSEGVCEGVQAKSISAVMECAGNRRTDLNEIEKSEGIPWDAGAISNASWSGIGIRSLLLHLGVPDPYGQHDAAKRSSLSLDEDSVRHDCAEWAKDLHLHLLSAQGIPDPDQSAVRDGVYFAASLPLATAMHPRQDCLLATHQNGELLTQAHGFPLRAVIPGHIGARWVKWLRGLRVSAKADQSPPMKMDYKMLVPPSVQSDEQKAEWLRTMSGDKMDMDQRNASLLAQPPMQIMGIGSAIQSPRDGEAFSTSTFTAEGYAVGTDGQAVTRVEVIVLQQDSEDMSQSDIRARAATMPAKSWTRAVLRHDDNTTGNATWSWSLWSANMQLPHRDTGKHFAVVARAVIENGLVQEQESPWNVRGFAVRSWPVVRNVGIK